MQTKATLGQTVYGRLPEAASAANDMAMGVHNRELYSMFMLAFMKGSTIHILHSVLAPGKRSRDGMVQW